VVCDPALRVSDSDVTVGQPVDLEISGATTGRAVTLEGYARPSTTYTQLRAPVPADEEGVARFAVRPTTNTRLRVRIQGCPEPGTSQVLVVHAGLSLSATRTGVREYVFAGSILPARPNVGRSVALYYRAGTAAAVRRGVATVRADGTYRLAVRFTGSARLTFFWQTGNNLVNAAATSNQRSVLVS
jgi:hypothetical protein